MTLAEVCPAYPICLTCIATKFPGATVNVNTFSETLYALAVALSVGYWTTPSTVTRMFSLLGTTFDKVKSVVLPLPVKLSTLLSDTSNVTVLSASIWPQNVSFTVGACENTIQILDQIQTHL